MKKKLDDLIGRSVDQGDILRAFRKRNGFSQDVLAEITGVERTNISAIENSRMAMTQHYAELFAAALGLHPSELLYPDKQWQMSKRAKEVARKAKRFK